MGRCSRCGLWTAHQDDYDNIFTCDACWSTDIDYSPRFRREEPEEVRRRNMHIHLLAIAKKLGPGERARIDGDKIIVETMAP